jgi:hypothetical protein
LLVALPLVAAAAATHWGGAQGGFPARFTWSPLAALSASISAAPEGHRYRLTGSHGFEPFKFRGVEGVASPIIDATQATFLVSNSRNPNPTGPKGCDIGTGPINRYPFTIENAPGAIVLGALFVGQVPQATDWEATYCNSAALLVRDATGVTIDGVRITSAWDAIRPAAGASNTTVERSWLSDVRDDAIENDHLLELKVKDSLIDGAFVGVSVKPPRASTIPTQSAGAVQISGLLLRLREYPYKGEHRFAAFIKSKEDGPPIRVDNSIVAIAYEGGNTWHSYWERTWKYVHGHNNLLLWLSQSQMPKNFVLPPNESGFRVVAGDGAIQLWSSAMRNWNNCHPDVRRATSDPRPDYSRCRADFWGSGSFAAR